MEKIIYTVITINGDYATCSSSKGNQTDIALALLPDDIDEGDSILFENFSYSKME